MTTNDHAHWLLSQEARAMLTRLDRVRPLVLRETMVPAAAPSPDAQAAIEQLLFTGRRALRTQLLRYVEWLEGPSGRRASSSTRHRRFVFLKLRFNAILFHFDLFSEAVSQRSQAETGVWLAGLDAAARDALTVPGRFTPPPVMCFLAKDPGGAIRRADSRLPGGGKNPVALIRLPRERMLGAGLASSLAHEAGHQAAALLELLSPVRASLLRTASSFPLTTRGSWLTWTNWLSEILADLWAIGRVGVASTMGLISLVSLPRSVVFQSNAKAPHPTPWLRVKLSCALGDALYPHSQWKRLAESWETFYPLDHLPQAERQVLERRQQLIPQLTEAVLTTRAPSLGGATLRAALTKPEITPERLDGLEPWHERDHTALRKVLPMTAFAALGQARADGHLTPEAEAETLAKLLEHWALRSALKRAQRAAGFSLVSNQSSSATIHPQRSPIGDTSTWTTSSSET